MSRFFPALCSQICILYVTRHHTQLIECHDCQCYTYGVTRNDRLICECVRCVSHVSPCYQSCLVPKILSELHVEDHMTPHELVVLWDVVLPSFEHLKSRVSSLYRWRPAKVCPPFPSIFFASSTDLGMQIPNLWVLSQYFDFTLASIRFLFLSTNGTHHANAGSIDMRVARANLATSTG